MGCSSGGTTSNLFTYYARADLALSISMTVTSTLAAVLLMPLVLVTVAAGVALRTRRPDWAVRAERVGSASGIVIASFAGVHEQQILRLPLLYGVLVVPVSAAVALAFRRAPA